MKRFSLLLAAGILMAATTIMNIFEELDFQQDKAKEQLITSFGRGNLAFSSDLVSKARNLPETVRVEGVRQLVRFAKDYTQTTAFKKQYTHWRNEQLGYKEKKKFGIPNPVKMLDKAVDKQLNKSDDEKKLPASPDELIKRRLKEFLDVSATVDFEAALSGRRFVNPEYENKSPQWKMCYRAGKAVVQAAREEVTQWLQELE